MWPAAAGGGRRTEKTRFFAQRALGRAGARSQRFVLPRETEQTAVEIEEGDAAGEKSGVDAKLRGQHPDTERGAPGEERGR